VGQDEVALSERKQSDADKSAFRRRRVRRERGKELLNECCSSPGDVAAGTTAASVAPLLLQCSSYTSINENKKLLILVFADSKEK
jgi:hypothetical protein